MKKKGLRAIPLSLSFFFLQSFLRSSKLHKLYLPPRQQCWLWFEVWSRQAACLRFCCRRSEVDSAHTVYPHIYPQTLPCAVLTTALEHPRERVNAIDITIDVLRADSSSLSTNHVPHRSRVICGDKNTRDRSASDFSTTGKESPRKPAAGSTELIAKREEKSVIILLKKKEKSKKKEKRKKKSVPCTGHWTFESSENSHFDINLPTVDISI